MSDFKLTAAERDSVLWNKLKKHFESQRAVLREKNDSIKLGVEQTTALRGRIAQLTDLLALDAPASAAPEGDA